MPDTKQLLRETRDRIAPPPDVLGGLERRRRHKENVKRVAAAAVAIVVALVGLGGWFVLDRDTAPRPADRSGDLGIFAPVAGRIVYENDGCEVGYDPGIWAVDPYGPSDTKEGAGVADDVASTLVRLDIEDASRSAGPATAPSCCSCAPLARSPNSFCMSCTPMLRKPN